MHIDLPLLLGIISAIVAGWLGGLAARRAGLPLLVGYVAAGILVGPHVLRLVGESSHVQLLATLGIVFLLFAQGVQISWAELQRVRNIGLYGGLIQVVAVSALGYGLGVGLGWSATAAIILGFMLAVSSTTVLVKVAGERGEAHAQYARIALGISITQDLSTVAMVSLLPALGTVSLDVLPRMGLLLAKAVGFIVLVLLLARTAIPALLHRVSATGSRELFLTTILMLCLIGSGTAELLGLSLALGAFLSGMMISESEFHYETYALVVPLRDAFGMLFFVSLGMLFDPVVLVQEWGAILLMLLTLTVGKFLIIFILTLVMGYHLRTAIMSGLSLVPISEYSLLLALLAVAPPLRYLSNTQYGAAIAAAIISVMLTPVLMHLGPPLYTDLSRLRFFRRFLRATREAAHLEAAQQLGDHVLVCGHGRVGRMVSEALRDFQVPLVVIDYDQHQVAALRREGVFALYGDASSYLLLQQSGASHAAMGVVCVPDSRSALLALMNLRKINAEMPLVARGVEPLDLERGYAAGAEEVVEAEFECGLELARHTLLRLGKEPDIVQHYIDQVRLYRYRSEPLHREGGAG